MKAKSLFAAIALSFFATSYVTDLNMDDFGFKLDFYNPRVTSVDYGDRMTDAQKHMVQVPTNPSLRDFCHSPNMFYRLLHVAVQHYCRETGRYTSGFLMRIACGMPRWLFALVNTLMWCVMVYCLLAILDLKGAHWMVGLLSIPLVLLKPQSTLWTCASVNYLWGAAFAMMGSLAFLSRSMKRRVVGLRILLLFFLAVAAVLVAGFHELISLTLSSLLLVYWVQKIARHEYGLFCLNGQVIATVFFWLGTLAVVFSPASINRAGSTAIFASGGYILWFFVKKAMAFYRCCMHNPIILIGLFIVVRIVWQRSTEAFAGLLYLVMAFLLSVVACCFLTDGRGDRVSWISGLCALMVVLGYVKHLHVASGVVGLLAVFNALLFGVTIFNTGMQNHEFAVARDKWLNNKYNQMVYPRLMCRLKIPFFDRSMKNTLEHGAGSYWTNFVYAKCHCKDACLVLNEDQWNDLNGMPRDLSSLEGMKNLSRWMLYRKGQFLVKPLEQGDGFCRGATLIGHPVYSTISKPSLWDKIVSRITRKGWAQFSLCSPEEEMLENRPLYGFVYETPRGLFGALRFNTSIPTENLISLELEQKPY